MVEPVLNNTIGLHKRVLNKRPQLKNRKLDFFQNLPKIFAQKDYFSLVLLLNKICSWLIVYCKINLG